MLAADRKEDCVPRLQNYPGSITPGYLDLTLQYEHALLKFLVRMQFGMSTQSHLTENQLNMSRAIFRTDDLSIKCIVMTRRSVNWNIIQADFDKRDVLTHNGLLSLMNLVYSTPVFNAR